MKIDSKPVKKNKYGYIWRMILIGIIALVLFTFQSAPKPLFRINGVSPNLLLPFVITVSVFFGEMTGAFFGLFSGLLLDLYVSPCLPFNSILVMIIGCGCGLITKHLMTKNFFSVFALSGGIIIFYYTLSWVVYQVIGSTSGRIWYYLNISIPSMVYSLIFIIPWFFLTKIISKNV